MIEGLSHISFIVGNLGSAVVRTVSMLSRLHTGTLVERLKRYASRDP